MDYYKPLALSKFSQNSDSVSRADSRSSSSSSSSLSSSPSLSLLLTSSLSRIAKQRFICSTSSICPLQTSARASLSHVFLWEQKVSRTMVCQFPLMQDGGNYGSQRKPSNQPIRRQLSQSQPKLTSNSVNDTHKHTNGQEKGIFFHYSLSVTAFDFVEVQ